MMIRKIVVMVALTAGVFTNAYGDSMPVAGSTAGAFTSVDTGSISGGGSTWDFASKSNLVYDNANTSFGDPFPQNTPLDINLGSLTLNNGSQGGLGVGDHFGVLDLTVTFTTPVGVAAISDGIKLTIDNGNGGTKVAVTALPLGSFIVSGVTYTVTIDGLYDAVSGGNLVSEIFTLDPHGSDPATSQTRYLRGTVTASGVSETVVPEPGSVSLLLTAISGVAFSLYRKRLI